MAPLPNGPAGKAVEPKGSRYAHLYTDQGSVRLLRSENTRLQRQVTRLEATLKKKTEQLRVLEGLAKDLQREMSELRAKHERSGAAGSAGA